MWDPTNGKTVFSVNFFDTTGSHSISAVTYTKRYHLYLAVTTDFKLLVYNEQLKYVKQFDENKNYVPIEIKVKLINHIHFWETESKLITAGVGG